MRILGISAFYHDSAAAIIVDGKIVAAAQEERFTRKKHDPAFPLHAVKYCLEESGTTMSKLDAVVFYDKPLLKLERLLETYYGFAPTGITSFITSMPVWLGEKMFIKRTIRRALDEIEKGAGKKATLLFPEHHLSHAASAFYPSPFEEAAILTVDGVGEWATASICHGKGKDITLLKELRFPHSLGLLYSSFTYFLGFRVNSGEYKLMGLAPYGQHGSERVAKYVEIIKKNLVKIHDDGSIWLNQKYFGYSTGLRMVRDHQWQKLFDMPRRTAESAMEQQHCDLALAIQEITEEVVQKMAEEARRLTGSQNLCMAGGVALNCVANGKLLTETGFDQFFFQPAAGDAGGAPGAALAAYHIEYAQERKVEPKDAMQGGYLGPAPVSVDIERVARKYDAPYEHFENFDDLTKRVAKVLAEGHVVGWHQGRMEFGPRALGARSILGDARNEEMQKKLNVKIKYRESFRPFAPAVLADKAKEYFDLDGISPYMLLVRPVAEARRLPVPDGYEGLPMRDKLYVNRSNIPAITHVDFSARIQTVHDETNPKFAALLRAFEAETGDGLLVNTSFNVRGEPIVNTPEDSYRCFMRTEMDFLVVGDYVFSKAEQPEWPEGKEWQEEFVLD